MAPTIGRRTAAARSLCGRSIVTQPGPPSGPASHASRAEGRGGALDGTRGGCLPAPSRRGAHAEGAGHRVSTMPPVTAMTSPTV